MSEGANWDCRACTFINPSVSTQCKMCKGPKNGHVKQPSKCTKCGSKTDYQGQLCANCNGKAVSNNSPLDAFPTKRVIGLFQRISPGSSDKPVGNQCRICTLINQTGETLCHACGSKLDTDKRGQHVQMGTVRYKHPLRFQRSVLGEELRRTENQEALKLFNHIKTFCQEVHKVLFIFYIRFL